MNIKHVTLLVQVIFWPALMFSVQIYLGRQACDSDEPEKSAFAVIYMDLFFGGSSATKFHSSKC